MNGIIYTLLTLSSTSILAQTRSLAVENEIIVENINGVQTTQFLEFANQSSQNMSIITLLTLFAFISSPFLVYLIGQKKIVDKQKEELNQNVILMSEFSSRKKSLKGSASQSKEDNKTESESELLDKDKAA